MSEKIRGLERAAIHSLEVRGQLSRRLEQQGDPRAALLQLSMSPSEDAWRAIVAALEDTSPEAQRATAMWLDCYLERWPDALRRVSRHWAWRLMQGQRCPIAVVGRALTLADWRLSAQDLEAMLRVGDLSSLVVLRIEDTRLSLHAIDVLMQSPVLNQLRSLVLRNNALNGQARAQLDMWSSHRPSLVIRQGEQPQKNQRPARDPRFSPRSLMRISDAREAREQPHPVASILDGERLHWRCSPIGELWLVDAQTAESWGAIGTREGHNGALIDPGSRAQMPLFGDIAEAASDISMPEGMHLQLPLWATPAQLLMHARERGLDDFLPHPPCLQALRWPIIGGFVPDVGLVRIYDAVAERFCCVSVDRVRWSRPGWRGDVAVLDAAEITRLIPTHHLSAQERQQRDAWVLHRREGDGRLEWRAAEVLGQVRPQLRGSCSAFVAHRAEAGPRVGHAPPTRDRSDEPVDFDADDPSIYGDDFDALNVIEYD